MQKGICMKYTQSKDNQTRFPCQTKQGKPNTFAVHECVQKKGVITMGSYSYRNISGTRFIGILYIWQKLKDQLISPNCLRNDVFFFFFSWYSLLHSVYKVATTRPLLFLRISHVPHCFKKFLVSRIFLDQPNAETAAKSYVWISYIFSRPERNQQIFEFNQSEKKLMKWCGAMCFGFSYFLNFFLYRVISLVRSQSSTQDRYNPSSVFVYRFTLLYTSMYAVKSILPKFKFFSLTSVSHALNSFDPRHTFDLL